MPGKTGRNCLGYKHMDSATSDLCARPQGLPSRHLLQGVTLPSSGYVLPVCGLLLLGCQWKNWSLG